MIRQGDREVELGVGDFAMWDSDREMEFRVLEPLHKLTLLIPKPRMKAFLGDAERYAGQVVPGSAGAGGIAAEALRRLAREFATLDEHGAGAVIDPMLSLLAATLMSRWPLAGVSAGHQESFRRFCRHIEQNLGDNELTPARVAAAHGVSLRYLHAVFAEQGVSGRAVDAPAAAGALPPGAVPGWPARDHHHIAFAGASTTWPISAAPSKRIMASRPGRWAQQGDASTAGCS